MPAPADTLPDATTGKYEAPLSQVPQILGGEAPAPKGKGKVKGAKSERDAEETRLTTYKGLTDEQVQDIVSRELDDAIEFTDSDIADARVKASQYYRGVMEDVPLEDGRSKVVHRVLHDVVMQIMPSLVEMFLGAEDTVTFIANKADEEEAAQQRTDYINYILREDNRGFDLLYAAFKDALIRRTGILKWEWDTRREITRQTYEGLLAHQVQQLANDPDVSDVAIAQQGTVEIPIDPDDDDAIGLSELQEGLPQDQGAPAATPPAPAGSVPPSPNGASAAGPQAASPVPGGLLDAPGPVPTVIHAPIYKVTIRREASKDKVRIWCLPGEEFLRSRNGRTLDTCNIVAHRSLQTRSDLIAMGYTAEWLDEQGSGDEGIGFYLNPEVEDREPDVRDRVDPYNESLARTLYTESAIRLDRDGDGIAELYRVCTVGWQHMVGHIEPATDIPFAVLCPNPEPHKFEGEAPSDDVMDLQRIMSMILRSSLDSLALSIHPRMVGNPNKVNMADVLNTEIGAVIRADDPTQVQALTVPFVGQSGITMFDRLEQVVQSRTGVLAPPDPQDMQSTTKKGVDITERQSVQRIALIARVFAETGMKDLFRGLQRLVMQHQDVPRTVRLRGKFVTVDPRTWDSEMDVQVAVSLGQGTKQERMGALQMIVAEMKEIFAAYGPSNPIVSVRKYRNTLAKMVQLMGFADASEFWEHVSPDWQPPAPPPDAATLLAQAQTQQIQAQIKIEGDKLELERQKALLEDQRERFKIEMDMQTKIAVAQITATKDANASQTEQITRMAEIASEAEIRAHEAHVAALPGIAAAQQPAPDADAGASGAPAAPAMAGAA